MENDIEKLSVRLRNGVMVYVRENSSDIEDDPKKPALILKFVNGKGFQAQALTEALRGIWRITGGLTFMEAENNALVAEFEDIHDRDRVLSVGPWLFNGCAIAMSELIPVIVPAEFIPERIPIWIQLHNQPLDKRIDKKARKYASLLGRVIDSSNTKTVNSGDTRRVFMRYKVDIEIISPLLPGFFLERENKDPVWVKIRYEHLPIMCFKCGRITHERRTCTFQEVDKDNLLGPWLRAGSISNEIETTIGIPNWMEGNEGTRDSNNTLITVDLPECLECWQPPKEGVMKINFDGSLQSDHQRVGLGTVARNYLGVVEAISAEVREGIIRVIDIEGLALLSAMKLATTRGWNKVIFESDALMVIDGLARLRLDTTSLSQWGSSCLLLLSGNKEWSLHHSLRSSNKCANMIARKASLEGWSWENFYAIPRFLQDISRKDALFT